MSNNATNLTNNLCNEYSNILFVINISLPTNLDKSSLISFNNSCLSFDIGMHFLYIIKFSLWLYNLNNNFMDSLISDDLIEDDAKDLDKVKE